MISNEKLIFRFMSFFLFVCFTNSCDFREIFIYSFLIRLFLRSALNILSPWTFSHTCGRMNTHVPGRSSRKRNMGLNSRAGCLTELKCNILWWEFVSLVWSKYLLLCPEAVQLALGWRIWNPAAGWVGKCVPAPQKTQPGLNAYNSATGKIYSWSSVGRDGEKLM